MKRFTYSNRGALNVYEKILDINTFLFSTGLYKLKNLTRFFLVREGCPVGTILSMPLSGIMSKYGFDGGWASVFYCFGKSQ